MNTKKELYEFVLGMGIDTPGIDKNTVYELAFEFNNMQTPPLAKEVLEGIFLEAWAKVEQLQAKPDSPPPVFKAQKLFDAVPRDWFGDGTRRVAYFDTGIPWIDANHGLEKRTILTAPSNVGKTLLAIQIARSVSSHGKKVLYLDFETSVIDLWSRFVTMGIPISKEDLILNGKKLIQQPKIKSQMTANAKKMENIQIIDTSAFETLEDLQAGLWFWAQEEECLVIIDQITGLKKFTQAENQYEQTNAVADWIREKLRDVPWTTLIISPQNKANYNRNEVVSITGSGELGYSADAIWAIQKRIGEDEKWNRRDVTLDILKSRVGSLRWYSKDLCRTSLDEFEDAQDVATLEDAQNTFSSKS